MDWLRRCTPTAAAAILVVTACVLLQQVSATRYTVGGNMGWNTNVNFTVWAQGKNFYNGDWLYFVYDRNQMNVLEVNKTDYETCNSDHFLQNCTTGAGRDVVQLKETRPYYFLSGKGFCWGGMKVLIDVQNLPPPPSAQPKKSKSASTNHPSFLLGLIVAAAAAVLGIDMIN
ncbi:lamin-like protein [Impatiens glandulifera]|uniref:lamin-like protein n=1 Tax=Impatiens glandulifera TaxID=253017 RepID=UPI001FB1198B|nr:lamin-like protein [Impatiens glandulifera]